MSEASEQVEGTAGLQDARHPATIAAHERLDRLRDEIVRLGLERNVLDLEIYGYTVLEGVKPQAFFDELRAILIQEHGFDLPPASDPS